jgi:hypothetical protein
MRLGSTERCGRSSTSSTGRGLRPRLSTLGRGTASRSLGLWERRDELYLTWLAFRLADEFEAYLRSGVGREFKTKEEFGGFCLGRWLPADLAPLFWLRLVGDAEGEAEFRAAWVTAVNMWFEGMAAPYTPKKPAVARKAVELFNAL